MRALVLVAALVLSFSAHAENAGRLLGAWRTPGAGEIEIKRCGERLCGLVTRQEPATKEDQAGPPVGHMVLVDFSAIRNDRWQGTIIDPRLGSAIRGVMMMTRSGQLRIEGCLGVLCDGETWTRAVAGETVVKR